MSMGEYYKGPCSRDCKERSATCHIKCEKYLEFVAFNEEVKAKRSQSCSYLLTQGKMQRRIKWLKYRKRK